MKSAAEGAKNGKRKNCTGYGDELKQDRLLNEEYPMKISLAVLSYISIRILLHSFSAVPHP